MNKPLYFIALFIMAISTSCSDLKVTSDFDKEADFSQYKTFNIMTYQEGALESVPLSRMTLSFLEEALIDEMMKRGYTLADDPDIEVYYYLKLKDKQQVVNSGPSVGMYYGSPYYYGYYGGYAYYNESRVVDYTEGTLIIELVDNNRDRAIWQGVAHKSVTQQSGTQKEIQHVMKSIFFNYKWKAEPTESQKTKQEGAKANY